MKQVVLRNGSPVVGDVPAPAPAPGYVLVATQASVVSSGTERTAVSEGSIVRRVLRNPELVRMGLEHLREQGLRDTVRRTRNLAAADVPIGYACAGTVLDTGGVGAFHVGQTVACAGLGHANHAEVVSVPANLVVAVPDGVDVRDGAFATLGAIALQGVRRAEPTLGERVVVVGLGLLGLLTVQLLRANGCPVLGVEPNEQRRALALELGAERVASPDEAAGAVQAWSGGLGADAAIVTASSSDDAVLNSAIAMLRVKGRVVPVGAVGMGIARQPLYLREADVRISTSYGPGRYDDSYELGGVDYPPAYVRWTEQRNMEAFLRLVATGAVRVRELVDLERPAEAADEVYAAVRGEHPPLAAVFTYDRPAPERLAPRAGGAPAARTGEVGVALVGAGAFVRGTHLPTIRADSRSHVTLVVNRRGTTAGEVAREAGGGARAATDWREALADSGTGLVVIGTRHDSHAEIAAEALRAGKAVFVEKPLGLSRDEIDRVWEAGGGDAARLAIGFNRPFAPLARKLQAEAAAAGGPIHLVYRVNAPLDPAHWLNDPVEGGGRILGEACHMIDFALSLCGTPLRVSAAALPARTGVRTVESASITIQHATGSVSTVHYSGVGPGSLPKERVEVLRGGRAWVLDDFRSLTSYAAGEPQRTETGAVDKGHAALMRGVLAAARGERPFEPGLRAAYLAQSAALAALEAVATGESQAVVQPGA